MAAPGFVGAVPQHPRPPPAPLAASAVGLDEEDLDLREDDEEEEEEEEDGEFFFYSFLSCLLPLTSIGTGAPGKKRGRRESHIHGYCVSDGRDLLCQVKITRTLAGQRVEQVCGKRLRYLTGPKRTKSPKSMTDHLASAHHITKEGQGPVQGSLAQGMFGEIRIDQPVKKWTTADARTTSMVEVVAKWFAVDGLPPHNVGKPGFRAAFSHLIPEFPGVTPPTVFARFEEYAGGFVEWFEEFQQSVDWFALTTDGWSDDANHHYRTVTSHFMIPKTWTLVALVLKTAVCGGNDHEIADFVLSAVREYKMLSRKIVAVTSDNANAEVAGLRLTGIFRIPCGCHLLNLTMKLVLDEGKAPTVGKPGRAPSPVLGPVKRLSAIVNKLHNAPLFMQSYVEIVEEAARFRNVPVPKLPMQDIVTRWNSTSYMIDSCLVVRKSLDRAVAANPQYGLDRMSAQDWVVIKQVGALLRPFLPLSKFAEGAKYATVPDYLGRFWMAAAPLFYQNLNEQLVPEVAQLKSLMRVDFGRRLHRSKNDMTLAGLALHPT